MSRKSSKEARQSSTKWNRKKKTFRDDSQPQYVTKIMKELGIGK